MDAKNLQKRQADYDLKGWQHSGDELVHIRHVTLHLGKLLGELSSYCEMREHEKDAPVDKIKTAVIPDIIMHALRLANLLGVDAEKAFLDREKANIERYCQ
jgi:hypothetical protein